jgi:hypothetical protein
VGPRAGVDTVRIWNCCKYYRPIQVTNQYTHLKMESISSSETSVETQRTTRRHIPEDDTLQCTLYICTFPSKRQHDVFFKDLTLCKISEFYTEHFMTFYRPLGVKKRGIKEVGQPHAARIMKTYACMPLVGKTSYKVASCKTDMGGWH